MARIGVIHPGEMGAGIAGSLVRGGHQVFWAAADRSEESRRRADAAGLRALDSVKALCEEVEVVFSICPPHAALEVAAEVVGFGGLFVDANAISPGRAAQVAELVRVGGARTVDGGIIGSPPPGDHTRLYLSGPDAPEAAALFRGGEVAVRVLSGAPTAASAVKMTFAAWTKGSAALLLAIRATARAMGVEDDLVAEWNESAKTLPEQSRRAARSAEDRGWRWVGEMEEIARTFADAGLPDGFHLGAAEIYRRSPHRTDAPADDQTLDEVLDALLGEPSEQDE